MGIDVRKVITDAGYVSIGLGVLGYQQAQTRRRELGARLDSAGECIGVRAREMRSRVSEGVPSRLDERAQAVRVRLESRIRDLPDPDEVRTRIGERTRVARETVDARAREMRGVVEEQTRAAIDRVQLLGDELGRRVEPLVDRLPEPVAKAVEPLRTRMHAPVGSGV
ncbi:MAG: apolipoprotein A1/A4/E family protein [Acidimicrobiia bacterium]|nr:apolipoprotein A1/A4/E family protein [Acidimicrobiia bacterium]